MILALLVFLSYAHVDSDTAMRLVSDLRRGGCAVSVDSTMRVGRDWTRDVERAIDAADVVVVLLSDAATRSVWVRREVMRADRIGKRIVVVDGGASDIPLTLELLPRTPQADAGRVAGCNRSMR